MKVSDNPTSERADNSMRLMGIDMFKNLIAFATAATCAAIFVTLVPAPGPAVGSALSEIRKGSALTISAGNGSPLLTNERGAGHNGACRDAWPYYEQSCLTTFARMTANRGQFA
jgi:hypothetical protein